MKKFTLLSTLVIIAALALGACTSTPNIPATGSNNTSPTSVSTGTQAAAASPSVTGTASASGASSTGTPVAANTSTSAAPATTSTQPAATSTTAAPTAAQTTATTSASGGTTAQSTATTSATGGTTAQSTATAPAATAAATGTSAAGTSGTPQAGVSQPQFLRLTNLMNLTVQTSDAQPVGAVNSVVVDRPSATASASANSSTVTASAPVVRYVVVNLDSMSSKGAGGSSNNTSGTGNQVIVPWQTFNFSNLVVGQGSTSQTASTSTLTMKVSMSAFAGAPRVDVTQIQNNASSNWQSQVSQFWASQGLGIPTTGNNSGQPSNLVFIGKQMDGFNVVGTNNAVLGQVADFLVNIQTGEIAYAVITPQGMNGQSFYIPLSSMSWQFPVGQNSMTTLGNLVINITPAILQNAPSLGSLNNLQINPSVLQQLNQFWQGIQSTPTK